MMSLPVQAVKASAVAPIQNLVIEWFFINLTDGEGVPSQFWDQQNRGCASLPHP